MYQRTKLIITNEVDKDSNPAGGTVEGIGLSIKWQNKPLGRPANEPNGTFVEDVIIAAKRRLEFYQNSKFSCRENALAITKLDEALQWLYHRRIDREDRQVQGLNIK